MLQIVVPEREYWNERTEEFIYTKEQTLCLEHSLVSLSKWEAKWKKPFLSSFDSSAPDEEVIDYIKCMTVTQNVDSKVYLSLTPENLKEVFNYIEDPMTATKIKDNSGRTSREVITAELIYQWMIALNIPLECQKWHLNRLLMLIRVCDIKNSPPKKMGKERTMIDNSRINEMRKKQLKTTG